MQSASRPRYNVKIKQKKVSSQKLVVSQEQPGLRLASKRWQRRQALVKNICPSLL